MDILIPQNVDIQMMSFSVALACQHIYVLKFRQPINLKLKFANNYAKVNRALKSNTSIIVVTNTFGINQNVNALYWCHIKC